MEVLTYHTQKEKKKAGKNTNELKAYYMITYGIDRFITLKEYSSNKYKPTIESRQKAIDILLA